MRLGALRARMAWSTFGVFLVGVIFATAMIYVIDLFLGYLFQNDVFALFFWSPIPFTSILIPIPQNILWALLVGAFMLLFQWLIGPITVRAAVRLRYVDKATGGGLYEEVESLSKEANIPMPKVAIVESEVPNAFVFGRTTRGATLAVHTGLLKSLNRRELRGVLAHELGHIRHKDLIVMTLAAAIPLIALMVLRGAIWGSWAAGSSSDDDGAGALILLLMALAVISAIIFGSSLLIVRGLSRMREHYADSYSARLTEDPRGLQSALAKISWGLSLAPDKQSSGLRSFYVSDIKQAKLEVAYIRTHPQEFDLDRDGVLDERELLMAMEKEAKRHRLAGLRAAISTHPPTFKRILLLKDVEKELSVARAVPATVDEEGPGLETI